MSVTKTNRGWVIDITNTAHGCLEQGGVSGRRVLYTRETLAECGINYDANPEDSAGCNDPGVTNVEYLIYATGGTPDKVIRRGHEIQ